MGEWRRDTPWRQGHILTPDSAKQLGFEGSEDEEAIVVVISHDCDLAQLPDTEPLCEVIVGTIRDEPEGNFSWAKSPRKLHLRFTGGNLPIVGDLTATNRKTIEKSVLADHVPNDKVQLNPAEKSILRQWLSARYLRAAFPDEFENRLKAKPGKVHEKIMKILAGTDDHVVEVLADLDRGKEIERTDPADPYELTLFIVYSAEKDPGASLKVATDAAKNIRDAFRKAFLAEGKWQGIELRDAMPISEDAITARQQRNLKRWNADHLSLRDDEEKTEG